MPAIARLTHVGNRRLSQGVTVAALAAVAALASAAPALAGTGTAEAKFETAGQYTWTVPPGVHSITVTAIGAAGQNGEAGGAGGEGAKVSGTLGVTPGEVLFVGVGGLGGIGGGARNGSDGGEGSSGGQGGGASVLGTGSPFPGFGALLLVAGGGGGGGPTTKGGNAGAAGISGDGDGGGAGTSETGGSGGAGGAGNAGTAGTFGLGGEGGSAAHDGGGGGGGGYYGGGGGGGSNAGGGGVGGGGGSSFISPLATSTSGPTVVATSAKVVITYDAPELSLSETELAFGTEPKGSMSAQKVVTVDNVGLASLVVSGFELSGLHTGDYIVEDGCQTHWRRTRPASSACGLIPRKARRGASRAWRCCTSSATRWPAPMKFR